MRAALPVLLVVLTGDPFLVQQPITPPPQPPIPAPNSRVKSRQHEIVVQGCVRNGRLRIAGSVARDLPFDMLNVSEFILDGPKEMLRQIKELHNGHYDEIAGIAMIPPPPQGRGRSRRDVEEGAGPNHRRPA